MTEQSAASTAELCQTCGTRLPENATRCLVCGAEVSEAASSNPSQSVQGTRMPEITLTLPAALGLLALFVAIGAALVFFAIRQQPEVVVPATATATSTATLSPTPSPTPETPVPTFTALPTPTPFTYEVKDGDTCAGIAFSFDVSILSIVQTNNLPADCGILFINQQLLIPQPTATASPLPSATLSAAQATEAACEKFSYEVEDGDTLSGIAANYNVPASAIKEYNGLVTDAVLSGQTILIPLCERGEAGPTPTPTPPPPYAAPNLLLPADGSPFNLSDDSVTLQWAAVGTLRPNEAYAVTVEDITEGEGRKIIEYVTDTKLIVPSTFRPNDAIPHVLRWFVVAVRQVGTDDEGLPIYQTAGAASQARVFTWSGAPGTPSP